MQTVTFIFVNKEKTLFDKWLGWLITSFEHGEEFASHVAIQFDYLKGYGPCILEALSSGVVLSPVDKYDTIPKQCRITLNLTDKEYIALENRAIEIAEHKYSYSYKSVIIGGIADSFSRRLAKLLSVIFSAGKDNEMDCSETGTELVREVYNDIISDEKELEAQITPF